MSLAGMVLVAERRATFAVEPDAIGFGGGLDARLGADISVEGEDLHSPGHGQAFVGAFTHEGEFFVGVGSTGQDRVSI